MLVLGIETSCDDTAAAVVRDARHVLSSVVSSQSIHRLYGGVVPEIASRQHVRLIVPTVRTALAEAGVELENVDAIAVTKGPGLIGSLLVGLCFAKTLSFAQGKPYIGINHIEAHLFAPLVETDQLEPPFVGLCVSGGHTELMYVRGFGDYELLGSTVDDAAGEAIDKVAKMLGLGFPGGPEIEALSSCGDPDRIAFPKARLKRKGFDMSFSGIKTAVKYFIEREAPLDEKLKADVAASFEKAIVGALVEKLVEACRSRNATRAVVAGGVARNRALREAAQRACAALGVRLIVPSRELCSDNGVMVAVAGTLRLCRGETSSLALAASSTFEELLEIERS
ncbi:MAG: tRNA (adenosine(37)-N6)-threonylcarbamoyltransferase complex transferase subunit TsaD [Candidatus Eisenbacteria bacterium]|nr:tRNA (adenosine(37)-N6)-threonylcarbamoyltransferase complex transferase subunit TsaD [Candidatus Eisenbacteria bacterium]